MAVTFDRNLRLINVMDLTSLDYLRVNRMKRIRGEETLILGCNRSFSIVDVENRSFREVGNIPNVHNYDILDFEMKDRYLYSKGDRESQVKVTTFGVKKEAPKIVAVEPASPKPIVFKESKYEKFKRTKIDTPFITGKCRITKTRSKKSQ